MNHLQILVDKIVSEKELAERIADLREQGKKVVFTNGCFDILHKGHVTYLAKAADLGDVLVVGLNSDASVRRQGKGDDRPINDFDARALVIASLNFVDFVLVFDEDTPLKLIEMVQPDVLVKGGDYDPLEEDKSAKKYIVGREVVLGGGGLVKTINLVDGFSTTSILNKLKDDN
jgi:rfaE bifunctional protein nucleotidyltransferase chain/domain